jgi:hypothetical protein
MEEGEIKEKITSPPPPGAWKFVRRTFGIILLVVGFVALFTPLTPGAWLILVGGEMLGIGILSRAGIKRYYRKLRGQTIEEDGP